MSDTTHDSGHDSGEDLGPDEKRCPYCAETIKSAAVKCRYCQSDLTDATGPGAETEPVLEPVLEPAPEPETEPVIEPTPEPRRTPVPEARLSLGAGDSRQTGRLLVVGLLVLCLVLGGGLWFLVHRADHPRLGTAPNGQVTQGSFRDAAMSAASDAAGQILSYSYQSFDADRKKGRALVTGEAAKEYEKAMDEVAAKVASTKITLKATVLSVGTISVKEHEARMLVFVDTATTREGSKQQQLQQSRLVMSLTRKDGDWSVSKMDAF